MSGAARKSSDLRTDLGRVRGLGSARDGTYHFWLQRMTAVALVPLSLWFVIGVLSHIGADYDAFREWIGSLPVAILMILTLLVTFWHTSLGLQIVVEDYIHGKFAHLFILALIRLSCFALALAGTVSVLKFLI